MASTTHEESSEERISNLDVETIPMSDLRAGIVGWESQDDPAMPRNYSSARKWFIVAVLSSISMVTPFASAINSPAISSINKEFGNTNSLLATLSVTIYLLGYAIGPLILAPLCELYGRKSVISTANICFCLSSIGCALAPNMAGLTVLRLLAGMGGSGCLTLGAAVVSDLFPANARGRAMGILTCGPLLGPTLGPLVGGFIVSDMNWRWVFWVVVIIGSVFTILFQFGATETNPRILIQGKTISLRRALRRDDLRSCYDSIPKSQKKRQIQRVCNGLVQPAKLFFLSPLVLLLSIYIAFVYGTMYLLFTTVTLVFSHTYGFSERQTGLVFLSLGAGTSIGWLITTIWSDRDVARLVRANNETYVPEMRLHITLGFAFLVPLTFFWYGWSAYYKAHFMSTILSLIPFQTGIVGVVIPMTTYLIDSYPVEAANAMAAMTVLRSIGGMLLPLAGPSMYRALGYGWGNSLLGFICVGLTPLPWLFYMYGGKLRAEKNNKF